MHQKLVYVPNFNMKDADLIIQKGYRVVFGSELNPNMEKEASEMKCKYVWKNNRIVEIDT